MPYKFNCSLLFFGIIFSQQVYAAEETINSLEIKQIRSVGDYVEPKFSKTIEIHFASSLNLKNGLNCDPKSIRVMVNAQHKHIVAAAYLALALGKKININIDDQLPIRNGSCEISFLDIVN